jgi:hypothetical protein
MAAAVDHTLVSELARAAVAEAAPQELPLFAVTAEAYFERPHAVDAAPDDPDDLLGFGGAADLTMLTPVALAAASAVIQFIIAEAGKATRKEAEGAIGDGVAAIFKKLPHIGSTEPVAAQMLPTFTTAQLAEVREVAFEKCRELRLPVNRANLVADAMVGSLTLHTA